MRFSHAIGIDDAPFSRSHRGDVAIIGAVCAGTRLEGVLSSKVQRDGRDATEVIARMIEGCRFAAHLHAVLLQGIALAGFNVVDLAALHESLRRPVLVVARRRPNLVAIRAALRDRVPGGAEKWALIEKAGAMEPCSGVWVQRAGLSLDEAEKLLAATTERGKLPEALRLAHLIAGGVTTGESTGRA